MSKLKEKYRSIKDSIDTEIGKKVEKILCWILIVIFLLFIPFAFTIFSTMAGSGQISFTGWHVLFYTTWTITIILFLVWLFFREYKFKQDTVESEKTEIQK